MPAIESEPAVEFARVHPAGSVTVMTFPFTKSFADGQLVPKPLKVTVWPVARTKLGLKTTLIVFDGDSAPVEEVVRPTVQVELAIAAVEPGENVAIAGADANAASAENAPIRPPSAVRPTITPTSRLDRGRWWAADGFATRGNRVMEGPFDERSSVRYPGSGSANPGFNEEIVKDVKVATDEATGDCGAVGLRV
jgi:hypothetical protein